MHRTHELIPGADTASITQRPLQIRTRLSTKGTSITQRVRRVQKTRGVKSIARRSDSDSSRMDIQPATLVSQRWHTVPQKLRVCELFFSVPLDHAEPSGKQLRLFARSVQKILSSATSSSASAAQDGTIIGSGAAGADRLPWMVYVPGGPGFGANQPQDYGITNFLLEKGKSLSSFVPCVGAARRQLRLKGGPA